MAEAAGLVLGGIALAGLISTCVEISEYLESAKNRARDFRLALTKVNLVKQRLRAWAAALPVDIPRDPQSNHTTNPTDCMELIREPLLSIKILLDNTNEMSKRHCLRSPSPAWDVSLPSAARLSFAKLPFRSHSVSDLVLPIDSLASFGTAPPRLPQLLFSFQLKILSVFQDRKRFESVIDQLDFFLSNLEKISKTLDGRREMAHNNGSEHPEYSNWTNGPEEESDRQSTLVTDEESMVVDSDEENQVIPTEGCLITSLSQSPGQPLRLHPSHNHAGLSNRSTSNQAQADCTGSSPTHQETAQDRGRQPTKCGSSSHRCEIFTAHDHSDHFIGNIGNVSESSGQAYVFVNNRSYNESMMLEGSINLGEVAQLLKDKRADRRKEKADERKAAAASSRGGINKKARKGE